MKNIVQLNYFLFSTGYCTHPECITIKGGRWRLQKYPVICALIQHPQYGYILFDTGYSPRFFEETKKWPFCLYKIITPVQIPEEQTLLQELKIKGIQPENIKYIVLSHFHADHIAGIKDFPKAKIICSSAGFESVKGAKGIKALTKGFLSGLLPNDFESRVIFLENKNRISLHNSMSPFFEGIDILGDESIIAISLSGHAKGQFGLLFYNCDKKQIFLVADSCWSSKAYRNHVMPTAIAHLILDNKNSYKETLSKLHKLYLNNKQICIIPSHCQEICRELLDAKNA
jgi:glyoxylase-like metal-dependent hydrolase (beta-lactamase superfamily II)